MIAKPVMQNSPVINFTSKESGYISFWATPDAAKEFEQFGQIFEWGDGSEKYSLYIDDRFDFDEVLAYIKNYDHFDFDEAVALIKKYG